MRTKVKMTLELKVPRIPEVLQADAHTATKEGTQMSTFTVPVTELTTSQLRKVARQWTKNLLAKAKDAKP